MDKFIDEYENEITKIVNDELDKVWKKFAEKNISIPGPSLKKYNTKQKTYTSEIEILFYKNNNLIDVIEFYVIYQKELWIKDTNEFRSWLREVLEKVFVDN